MKTHRFLPALLAGLLAGGLEAQVKALTDNTPDYSDLESAARSMTAGWKTDEQKAIALWKWTSIMRFQVSPAKDSFSIAASPDSHPTYGIIYNPIKLANNYANTFCVSTNSVIARLWRVLGKEAVEYDIVGHTVADLQYGGGLHQFDAAFGFFYRDPETGRILSLSDIMERRKSLDRIASEVFTVNRLSGEGWGQHGIYSNTRLQKLLYKDGSEYTELQEKRETLYTEKYSDDYTYRIRLKPFERYTRRWSQIADHYLYYLPARNWDVYGKNPNTAAEPGPQNIVTNGVWTFRPDFRSPLASDAFARMENVRAQEGELRPAGPKKTAVVIYRMDAANVVCNAELRGAFRRAGTADRFEIHFSADSSNWIPLLKAGETGTRHFSRTFGAEPLDLTRNKLRNLARTRVSYFLKIVMEASKNPVDCALLDLEVTTVTILNPRTLPRLTLGSNRVKVVNADPGALPLSVRYHWTELEWMGGGAVPKPRSHFKRVGGTLAEYYVNTAGFRWPVMDSLVLEWDNGAAPEGYSDGIDAGAARERRNYFGEYGRNIAVGKPVSSKPALTAPERLTNGSDDLRAEPAEWPAGANPEITVDLGKTMSVEGVRIGQTIDHGELAYFDSTVAFTSADGKAFTRRGAVDGQALWNPVTNYLYPNTWDMPGSIGKRSAAILFHRFDLFFDAAVQARFVKLTVVNAKGALKVAEVEVFDKMKRTPVENEIDHGFTIPNLTAATLPR